MTMEQLNGNERESARAGFINRVGGGVLDLVHPGQEHGRFITGAVGVVTIVASASILLEATWLFTLNTGAGQP